MKTILIVEDNKKIRDELCSFLTKNGYSCSVLNSFESVVSDILRLRPHLVLLDINLPVTDGYYICRELRKQSDIPILVVTSRDSEIDELTAISLGADDYVTKPYNTQILLARIAAVLKRAYKESVPEKINCGIFTINLAKSAVQYKDTETELTKNELKMLCFLVEHRGSIVGRDELMTHLWDSELFVDDNTLTVNINRLRKKLADFGLSDVIETRRGQGYLLR